MARVRIPSHAEQMAQLLEQARTLDRVFLPVRLKDPLATQAQALTMAVLSLIPAGLKLLGLMKPVLFVALLLLLGLSSLVRQAVAQRTGAGARNRDLEEGWWVEFGPHTLTWQGGPEPFSCVLDADYSLLVRVMGRDGGLGIELSHRRLGPRTVLFPAVPTGVNTQVEALADILVERLPLRRVGPRYAAR